MSLHWGAVGRGLVALWVGVRSSGGPTWWAGSCFKSGVSRVPVLSCEQFPGFFQGLLLVYVKRKQKQIIKGSASRSFLWRPQSEYPGGTPPSHALTPSSEARPTPDSPRPPPGPGLGAGAAEVVSVGGKPPAPHRVLGPRLSFLGGAPGPRWCWLAYLGLLQVRASQNTGGSAGSPSSPSGSLPQGVRGTAPHQVL